MISIFRPGPILRLFQRLRIPRKLGIGEVLFQHKLSKRGITWVGFGTLRWKLNLKNSTHRWLVYGEYEERGVRPLLERVLDSRSVIIDSGANIGQMLLMYLRCSSPKAIHAFEPTTEAREWLMECVAENHLSNVIISPLALGQRVGTAKLCGAFSLQEGARNFVGTGGNGHQIAVATLDEYAVNAGIKQIRFWKLDVEGHELQAILGADALLRRSAIDILYVETADSGVTIARLLATYNYQPTTMNFDRLLTPIQVGKRFTNIFVSQGVAREQWGQ